MLDEISADVLVAANDHGNGKRIAFGMTLDLPASVIVYACSPRGSGCFEFAARPMPVNLPVTLLSTSRVH
jgi:hypothetical protein